MGYTKQGFVNNDETKPLTAEQLIAMEDGIIANERYNNLKSRKISFLGDSITTFKGWIPSQYRTWYDGTKGGIDTVDKTWWKQLIDTLGLELVVNASASGSFISKTDPLDADATPACNMKRINELSKNGIIPDIIVVNIGTNDFTLGLPVGDWNGGALPDPEQVSYAKFKESYALMIANIMKTYKTSEIYCCTILQAATHASFDKVEPNVFPTEITSTDGSTVTMYDYNKAIREVADILGANVIDFARCGMHYFNATELYYVDGLHPNSEGAKLMAKRSIADILSNSRFNYPENS